MMHAGALHCPSCGAAAPPDVRQCPYCAAALARIACASCFGTLFVGQRFCPHCGVESAQRRQMDSSPLACPRCRPDRGTQMTPIELDGVHLDECLDCGGAWIEHGTFERICTDAQAQTTAMRLLAPTRSRFENVIAYLKCPLCDHQMARRNYATRSGIIVDVCPEHGLWFDHDELRRIVEFIRAGGLEDAREADRQRRQHELERRIRHEETLRRLRQDDDDDPLFAWFFQRRPSLPNSLSLLARLLSGPRF
jgi:Zn-finger nucleic acid-binding protein